MMDKEILFKEKQSFRQWWIWLIILAVCGWSIYGFLVRCMQGQSSGDYPISDDGLVVACVVSLLLLFLFIFLKLETRIGKEGVYVRFFPFQVSYKYFPWEEISRVYVRKYHPLKEYGGWGIRGFGKNRALNVSGNQGLQLELMDGRKLLIGTCQPEKITKVLQAMNR